MKEFNPYEAPVTDLSTPRASGEVGVWRNGIHLVMSKDAELPDRCLKCNAPAGGWRLKRKLMWHPQGYYLLVLFNLFIYVIVAMIVRHTARLQIPLCPRHRRRRRRLIAAAWILCLLSPSLLFLGSGVTNWFELNHPKNQDINNVVMVSTFSLAAAAFIAGIVCAIIASQVVVPQKIDKRFVWLRKVSPELLAGLPSWNA